MLNIWCRCPDPFKWSHFEHLYISQRVSYRFHIKAPTFDFSSFCGKTAVEPARQHIWTQSLIKQVPKLKYPLLEILTLISHLKNSCNLLMLNPYSIWQNVIGICRKRIGGIIMFCFFFSCREITFYGCNTNLPSVLFSPRGKKRPGH